MNDKRKELSERLHKLCKNVYFVNGNLGIDTEIKYPAITYVRTRPKHSNGNNRLYNIQHGYDVTYISRTTEDMTETLLLEFPTASVNNVYLSDGLYHQTFTIYL